MTADSFKVGQHILSTANVNVRRAPGYRNKADDDILDTILQGTKAVVLDGPETADELRWWWVITTETGGTPVEGWVAETAPGGRILLRTSGATVPRRTGPSSFVVGESVTNIASKSINLRRTPGYTSKPADDVVGHFEPGMSLIIDEGPQQADRLQWWKVGEGGDVAAWVAMAGPRGLRFIAPTEFADKIIVGMPFPTQYRVTQWWGQNPGFYHQFNYDGVPLRGHNGIDFGIPVGVPLLAVSDGTVRRTGFDKGGFGHFVLINHVWGESLYAHLSKIEVARGQQVALSEAIGLSGNTGASTGPHLHFGIRIHPYRRADGWGGFSDPEPFMLPETFEMVSFAAGETDIEPTPLSEEDPYYPRP